MKDVQKKVNGFINTAMFSSVLLVVLGIVFLVFPGTSLDMIRWIIAIFCLASGAYLLASDVKQKKVSLLSTSMVGILLLILGLLFAVRPEIMDIFPIVLGIWFIVSAVASGRFSAVLRGTAAGTYAIVTTILAFICGILLIVNPWGGQIAMVTFSGIMMIIYGASSLVDAAVLKHNINDLAKNLKASFSGKKK
ncbi:DUF308 domain-containing protein [Candidatus Saccharibacteria bacterium]|nr:DUF308 domain-containing protein [Candidatus Saccharibacteria bacterium]